MENIYDSKGLSGWRLKLHKIVYEDETFAGKFFDLFILVCIILSVVALVVETIPSVSLVHIERLHTIELFFTVIFSIEYSLRVISIKKPINYVFSFYGIIDILAIIPTYLSMFIPGLQSLLSLRLLRVLRIFRLLKLGRYLTEADILIAAIVASKKKIVIFLLTSVLLTMMAGSFIYFIEGPENGFDSIPEGVYWAISTVTTVGYGDIVPKTVFGKFFSGLLMIVSFAILAVPTGILSYEIAKFSNQEINSRACDVCGKKGHDIDAKFCKHCGGKV